MPTWLSVAAGNRPRSRSSAFARIERSQGPSGSPSPRGQRSAAHLSTSVSDRE